jgi:hypothetical protein
MSDVIF